MKKVAEKNKNIFGKLFSAPPNFFPAKKKWEGFQTQKPTFNRFP